MLEIISQRLILRDLQEEDVADYVRWYTIETEWMNWDAPWETIDEIDISALKVFYLKRAYAPKSGARHRFQLENNEGEHLGWVTSYLLEDNATAIGIDIPNPDQRKRGFGTLAYLLFLRYLLWQKTPEIYTQTWSGNLAMLKLAANMEFTEQLREVGKRQVHGKTYDALTLRLNVKSFSSKWKEEPLWILSDEWGAPKCDCLQAFSDRSQIVIPVLITPSCSGQTIYWLQVREVWKNTIMAFLYYQENEDVKKSKLGWWIQPDFRHLGLEERLFLAIRRKQTNLNREEFDCSNLEMK